MNSHDNKTKEIKNQAVANTVQRQQTPSTVQPQDTVQTPIQEIADNSGQVSQLRDLQHMADNSPQVKHTAQLQARIQSASASPVQKQALEEEPVQQKKENNTGLPDNLKTGVENLSGMSLDDVKVHYNSDKPSQLQAHAYAQGTDIHVASGQEKHLPHEAWHVVQQKQGRVSPTLQMKENIPVNDDPGLEKEADVMGEKALQAYSSERTPSGLSHQADVQPAIQAKAQVVQRAPIDLQNAVQIKPGPPPTLKDGNYFYKVFGTRLQADTMNTAWDTADSNGVLTPEHKVVQVVHGGANRWAFRSKEAPGTFFQFSKGGHTARVTNWINIQTDKKLLGRLRNIFSYVAANIGDGQGFFENQDGGDIQFIDINHNGTTPNAGTIVNDIDLRIAALP